MDTIHERPFASAISFEISSKLQKVLKLQSYEIGVRDLMSRRESRGDDLNDAFLTFQTDFVHSSKRRVKIKAIDTVQWQRIIDFRGSALYLITGRKK